MRLEALDSRASGFLYGASLVVRRVLQAALRSIVGEQRNLNAEIDAVRRTYCPRYRRTQPTMCGSSEMTPHTPIKSRPEDVDDLLAFTREVLHTLDVMPARVTATATRRQNTPA
jgi:hypothetical protein